METASPAFKFKPSQSGLPIPTLPISSATASQAAHIASLTSQVEELVNKNNALNSQHDAERQEWETRLVEERTRAEEAVRRIRDSHNKEIKDWKNSVETIQVASKHHTLMMAYAHDITKRNIASLETDLGNATQELEIRNLELQRAKCIQSRLQFRIEDMERVFKLRMAGALAQYEEAQTALVTSQNKISTLESKQVAKLKTDLQAAQASRASSEEALAKSQSDMSELEDLYKRLSLELKKEEKERQKVEQKVQELNDQIANSKRLEGKEADNVKESQKRVRELQVLLASEKTRVTDLEAKVEELESETQQLSRTAKRLEKEKSRLEADKDRLEREKEDLEGQMRQEKKKSNILKVSGSSNEKENVPEDKPKPKKRQRDDSDVEEIVERVSKKAKPEPKGKTKEKPSKPVTTKAKGQIYGPAPVTFSPVDHDRVQDNSDEEFSAPIVKGPSVLPKYNTTTAAKKFQRPEKAKTGGPPGLRAIYDSDEEEYPKKSAKNTVVDRSPEPVVSKEKKVKDAGKVVKGKKEKPRVMEEEREEYFDVDAVSETDDEEPVIVKTEPGIKKKTAKVDPPVKKKAEVVKEPVKEKKKPAEQARKPSASTSQPSQSTHTDRGELGQRPKKKGFNLLAGVTGGGGFGVVDNWMGRGDQAYGIPTMLSSPEKGAAPPPRARFDFGKY